MLYTYEPGGAATKDSLRLMIPDRPVEGEDPPAVFSDAELDRLFVIIGDLRLTVAEACDIIASEESKMAIYFTLNTGLSIDKRQVAKELRERAKQLREAAAKVPYDAVDSYAYRVDEHGRDLSEYEGEGGGIGDPNSDEIL
jgi:hypothetical protein